MAFNYELSRDSYQKILHLHEQGQRDPQFKNWDLKNLAKITASLANCKLLKKNVKEAGDMIDDA